MSRIVIIEDDKRYREVLVALLECTPELHLVDIFPDAVRAVAYARELVEATSPCPWDIAITDMNMPGMDGIEGIERLKGYFPDLRVLMLTVYEDPATILRAVCAGADGYLVKNAHPSQILEHIELVRAGGAPLTPGVAATLLDLVRAHVRAPPKRDEELSLTPREQQVLQCLVDGLSYKQVAYELSISIETVRTHIRHMYKKLQVHSVAEAVSRAIREGLVR